MIDFILSDANDKILDRDYLSEKAARELVVGAITGLVPNPKQVQVEVHNIMKAINDGQTIKIQNPSSKVSMTFQIPSLKKEHQAHKEPR